MAKQLKWTVYCHIHRESGRRYIGLTKATWRQRWNRHVYSAKKVGGVGYSHFAAAIRKYGKDAFDHEVLQVCLTLEEANEAEQHWIWTYDTRNPLRGFNLTPGGAHTPHPVKNPWDNPEFRVRATAASRKLWSDPAMRAKMSSVMKPICQDLQYRQGVSARSKKWWSDPKFRAQCTEASRKSTQDPKFRSKASIRIKGQWADPVSRSKRLDAARKKANDPGFRAKCKNNWSDPEYRSRCLTALEFRNAREAAKTHCKHGHEYTSKNTLRNKRGRRCRTCYNILTRTRRKKKRSQLLGG